MTQDEIIMKVCSKDKAITIAEIKECMNIFARQEAADAWDAGQVNVATLWQSGTKKQYLKDKYGE